jgi:hypothetical protein
MLSSSPSVVTSLFNESARAARYYAKVVWNSELAHKSIEAENFPRAIAHLRQAISIYFWNAFDLSPNQRMTLMLSQTKLSELITANPGVDEIYRLQQSWIEDIVAITPEQFRQELSEKSIRLINENISPATLVDLFNFQIRKYEKFYVENINIASQALKFAFHIVHCFLANIKNYPTNDLTVIITSIVVFLKIYVPQNDDDQFKMLYPCICALDKIKFSGLYAAQDKSNWNFLSIRFVELTFKGFFKATNLSGKQGFYKLLTFFNRMLEEIDKLDKDEEGYLALCESYFITSINAYLEKTTRHVEFSAKCNFYSSARKHYMDLQSRTNISVAMQTTYKLFHDNFITDFKAENKKLKRRLESCEFEIKAIQIIYKFPSHENDGTPIKSLKAVIEQVRNFRRSSFVDVTYIYQLDELLGKYSNTNANDSTAQLHVELTALHTDLISYTPGLMRYIKTLKMLLDLFDKWNVSPGLLHIYNRQFINACGVISGYQKINRESQELFKQALYLIQNLPSEHCAPQDPLIMFRIQNELVRISTSHSPQILTDDKPSSEMRPIQAMVIQPASVNLPDLNQTVAELEIDIPDSIAEQIDDDTDWQNYIGMDDNSLAHFLQSSPDDPFILSQSPPPSTVSILPCDEKDEEIRLSSPLYFSRGISLTMFRSSPGVNDGIDEKDPYLGLARLPSST